MDLRQKFCKFPFQRFDTLLDGTAALCCSIWMDERVGSLDEHTFEELWNGEAAQRIRASIHDGSFSYCKRERCTFFIHDTLPDKASITEPHLREVVEREEVVLDFGPEWLTLAHDVTCNLACPSCRSGILVADEPQKARLARMEDTVIEPILELGRTHGRRITMNVSGQGDPWSSSHYRSILKKLAQRDLDVELKISTNGLLMTEARWGEYQGLERHKPYLEVSIDACRPWTYEVLRAKGDFAVLEHNLEFIARKRREGAFSGYNINATVQLDNYHELADLVRLGQDLSCDKVRLYLIQNTGSHLAGDFDRKSIGAPSHPLHAAFLETLRDPIFDDPIVLAFDFDRVRADARATRLPSDEHWIEDGAQCVARVREALERSDVATAVALAAHGRFRFPDHHELLMFEGMGLESLGFAQQATYRYRELLRRVPAHVDAHVALGTLLVMQGARVEGVRHLVQAANVCGDPLLLDSIAEYLANLPPRPQPPVHLPVMA